MLVIHDLNNSRSQRIVWLVEELGADYKLVRHQRDAQTMRAPQSLWDISPMGKAPVIEDGGRAITESGAIVEYILEHYGEGALQPPRDSDEWYAYRHWMHAAESTLMTPALIDLLLTMTQTRSDGMSGFAMADLKTVFGYLESELGKHDHVAGQSFTAADIMVWFTAFMAFNPVLPGVEPKTRRSDYPNIGVWLDRLSQRPAYQKAMALSQGVE